MDWFYAQNGRQLGPVPEEQLEGLLKSGTINQETLVWRAGLSDWQPLRAALGQAVPPLPGGLAAPCAECRTPFPQSEMVLLNQSWVCAKCKPIFLQRLREGAAPGGNLVVWRHDRQLVTRANTAFPDRCVKCNAPAHGRRLKRQLSWHPSAYYLLLLVSPLIYIIVALIVRKTATLQVGICAAHQTRRRLNIAGCWLTVLTGIVLIVLGIDGNGWLALFGGVLILAAAIAGALLSQLVSAVKIDSEFVRARGAGLEFLATLPGWNGPN